MHRLKIGSSNELLILAHFYDDLIKWGEFASRNEWNINENVPFNEINAMLFSFKKDVLRGFNKFFALIFMKSLAQKKINFAFQM